MWRLQRGGDAECLAFRALADQGHYGRGGGTRQGIYVMAPGGKLLASLNSLDAEKVWQTLREGLAAWDALPEAERHLPEGSSIRPAHRWEMSFPADGLVLVTTVRDLPGTLDPDVPPASKWNRDHAWFTRDEARAWVPDDRTPGSIHDVPEVLVQRLARFHLVDNAVGQTLPYAPEEVAGSQLRSSVISVDGPRVRLRLTGSTRAVADGTWRLGDNDWTPRQAWPRGIRFELLGHATWDVVRGTFTQFELVAQGVRWGRTRYNGRRNDDPTGPIGLVLALAPPTAAHRVAPAFVDLYDADWIRRPDETHSSE